MSDPTFNITREKHLDHLVKVVPLIVLGYGVQSYLLMQMKGPFGSTTLFLLGGMLIFLICCFLVYDINHKVTLFEDHLEIHFLHFHKTCNYDDIVSIMVTDPVETFGSVMIHTKHRKIRLYFVDDVDKIKKWIENRKVSSQLAA